MLLLFVVVAVLCNASNVRVRISIRFQMKPESVFLATHFGVKYFGYCSPVHVNTLRFFFRNVNVNEKLKNYSATIRCNAFRLNVENIQ